MINNSKSYEDCETPLDLQSPIYHRESGLLILILGLQLLFFLKKRFIGYDFFAGAAPMLSFSRGRFQLAPMDKVG